MKRIIPFLTILALFNQCDDSESWLADKRFSNALFASEAECLAFQQHAFVNCYRSVWFKADGKMEIVFTDILTSGQYH